MGWCKDLKHAVACLKEQSRPQKNLQDKPPQQKLEISTDSNVRTVLIPGLMEVKIWLAHWTKIPTVQTVRKETNAYTDVSPCCRNIFNHSEDIQNLNCSEERLRDLHH